MRSDIAPYADLFTFFQERVDRARREDHVDLTDDAALYLTQLLADRARVDRPRPVGDTLAELHLLHATAAPARQVQAYRELGDRALHDLAMFQEKVDRTVVGPTYYQAMGRAAYARLHDVLERWFASAFGEVFAELAERFADCVELLRNVHLGCAVAGDTRDLLDRWERTGSRHLANALLQRGILVGGGSGQS